MWLRISVVAVILALVAFGVWVSFGSTPNQLADRGPTVIVERESDTSPSLALVPTAQGGVRAEVAEELAWTARDTELGDRLGLRLVDAVFETPVAGEVYTSGGARLGETDAAGRFRLAVDGDRLPLLEFRAVGYRSSVAAPVSADLLGEWLIPMEPASEAAVAVFDGAGLPIEGARVRIAEPEPFTYVGIRRPKVRSEESWKRTGVTDASGTFTMALAREALGEVNADGGVPVHFQLAPGETARVVIVRQTATLRIVDADSGEPVPGFLLTTENSLAPRQRALQQATDGNGEVLLPARVREVTVTLIDQRRSSASGPSNPRVTSDRSGYAFRFDRLRPGELLVLSVNQCSVPLHLVDAGTGEALEGHVRVDLEHRTGGDHQAATWSPTLSRRSHFTLHGGHVALGCSYLPRDDRLRVRLTVKGYSSVSLTGADTIPGAPPLEVAMVRGGQKVRVSVEHRDGSPYLGELLVHDDVSGLRTRAQATDEAGSLAPIPWEGGALTIFGHQFGPPGEDPTSTGGYQQAYLLGSITAGEIHGGRARLTLDFSPRTGQLRVQGAPPGSPHVYALDRRGIRRKARRQGPDHVFVSLPFGTYFVGTSGWLDGLEGQNFGPGREALSALNVSVVEGQDTELDWDPRWWLEEPLRGRVDCGAAHREELAIRPWYGLALGTVAPFDEVRLFMDRDGRYEIPAGQPRPEVLLVCTSNSSYWIQIVQAFKPGASTHVPMGGMVLEWQGDPPPKGNATVLYVPTDPIFDTPFQSRRQDGYYLDWNTLQPLVLNAVSIAVVEVLIDVKGRGRTAFPVVIEEGEVARVTIVAGDLAPPPDRTTGAHSGSHQGR